MEKITQQEAAQPGSNSWLITNGRGDYWSNSIGWVSRESADTFTDEEKSFLLLPGEGEWVSVGTPQPDAQVPADRASDRRAMSFGKR